jgi:hypothetical protein
MSVSYCVSGRFANNLIQYFAAKVLCKITNKKYEYKLRTNSQTEIGDVAFIELYNNIKSSGVIPDGNILLNEFYQSKEWLFPERDYLISLITTDNNDSINDTYKVSDLAKSINEFNNTLTSDTLVIHVRLDDYFHQGYNSDVIDPYSLVEHVNSLGFNNHIIVCDILREEWEKRYMDVLLKNIANSSFTSNSLLTDFCITYYAKNIVVSRSTFSWVGPILSPYTIKSWFPLRKIRLYPNQTIDSINERTINYTPKYLNSKY